MWRGERNEGLGPDQEGKNGPDGRRRIENNQFELGQIECSLAARIQWSQKSKCRERDTTFLEGKGGVPSSTASRTRRFGWEKTALKRLWNEVRTAQGKSGLDLREFISSGTSGDLKKTIGKKHRKHKKRSRGQVCEAPYGQEITTASRLI